MQSNYYNDSKTRSLGGYRLLVLSLISLLIVFSGSSAFAAYDFFELFENGNIKAYVDASDPSTEITYTNTYDRGSSYTGPASYTYDTQAHRPEIVIKVGDTTLVEGTDYELAYSGDTDANCQPGDNFTDTVVLDGTTYHHSGAAYVIINALGANEHFAVIPYGIEKLDLSTADIEYEITGSKLYDGQISHPTITKSILHFTPGDTGLDLQWHTNFSDLETNCELFDVGGYYVCINGIVNGNTIYEKPNTNYAGALIDYVYVWPAPMTCTWESPNTFTYNGSEQFITPTLNGVGSEVIKYSNATTSNLVHPESINVGNYHISVTPLEVDYSAVTDPDLLEKYEELSNDNLLANYVLVDSNAYTTYMNSADLDEYTTVSGYLGDHSDDLFVGMFESDYSITGAPLTVTANSYSITEGDPIPNIDYTITGEVGTEKAAKNGYGTTSATSTSPANTYPTSTTDSNVADTGTNGFKKSNYTITHVSGVLTINPAIGPALPAVTITADNKVKYYGQDDPTLTAQVSSGTIVGTPNGDLTRASGENVGHYDINRGTYATTANGEFDPANYDITFVKGDLEILPVSISEDPEDPTDPDIPAQTYRVVVEVSGEYIYNGQKQDPVPVVKLYDGTTFIRDLVSGDEYKVSYLNDIDAGSPTAPSAAGVPTVHVVGVGNFKDTQDVPYTIKPAPLYVRWSSQDTFQYDTYPHIRIGRVFTNVDGETVDFDLNGWKVNVGEDYPATIVVNGIDGGREKLANYDQSTIASDLTRYFKIVSLPTSGDKPTEEPHESGDPIVPSGEPTIESGDPSIKPDDSGEPIQPQNYTVRIEVTWPDDPYIYSGDEKKPEPTSIDIVIEDETGHEVDRKPLPSGDYTIEYEDNIHAATSGDPTNPPTATIKPNNDNITGDIVYKFTIEPRPLVVSGEVIEINAGDPVPDLTDAYTTSGEVAGDVPTFNGTPTLDPNADPSVPGEYTIKIDGVLTPDASDPETFNPDDYVITYTDGKLIVKDPDAYISPLYVRWSDQDTFQYDTFPHVRVGRVYTTVPGETVDYELKGWKVNVGGPYIAEIEIKGIIGGRGSLAYYDVSSIEADLSRQFWIVSLPTSGDKPTEEPHESGDPIVPSGEPTIVSGDPSIKPDDSGEPFQPQDYTVRIEVTWPDDPYIYSGDEKQPVPEKVEIVITPPDGPEIRKPVPSGDYKIEYGPDNTDAAESGDDPHPWAKIVPSGDNLTGEIEYPFTIEPRPLTVQLPDCEKVFGTPDPFIGNLASGQYGPQLTGLVDGEVPSDVGSPVREPGEEIGTYPITSGDGAYYLTDSSTFKASNYDITYVNGTFTITPLSVIPPSGDLLEHMYDLIYDGAWEYDYDGTEHQPEPVITLMELNPESTPTPIRDLVKGTDYTLTWENAIDAYSGDLFDDEGNVLPNVPQVVIRGNGTTTVDEYRIPFIIHPLPLTVVWNDKDTFQYDGTSHVRIVDEFTGLIAGETIEYEMSGDMVPAGTDYVAEVVNITITKANGDDSTGNYIMPTEDELRQLFQIKKLPIDEVKPTDDPEVSGDPTPIPDDPEDPNTEYTVEVIVTWPSGEWIYNGEDQEPKPEKVELVITDKTTGETTVVELTEDNEYTVDWDNNKDAADEGSDNPPTIIVIGDGINIEGQITHPFTIKPAKLVVQAHDKTIKVTQDAPNLQNEFDVTGLIKDEQPGYAKDTPVTTYTKGMGKGEYPIQVISEEEPIEQYVELTDNGDFKLSNYEIEYINGKLTVKPTGGGGSSTPTPTPGSTIDVAIFLSNGKKEDKGNNNYYLLGEEVTYYVDYENLKDAFSDTYKLTLELPLPFEAVELDGGKLEGKKITWTIPGGMKVDETGRKTVKVKFTEFSKGNTKGWEDIYPVDKIYVGSKQYDECTVHNIIYTLDNDMHTRHIIYMYGDEEKPTFRPDDIINRAEGALVLTRIFEIDTSNVEVKGDEFTDIGDTYLKAQQAIVKASKLGLIAGYEDGSYKPLQKMTRAEFMSIISRFVEYKSAQDGIKGMNIKEIQKDSKLYKKAGHWADKYVLLLARLNMAPEDIDTMESLNRKITRAEVAQLCNMYLLRAPVKDTGNIELPFNDVDSSHKLFGDIVEATRPTHEDFRLSEDAYEIWK